MKMALPMLAFILAAISLAYSQLFSMPSRCLALKTIYQDFASSDGFTEFSDFALSEVAVVTMRNGFRWRQSVTYSNPVISLIFGKPLATKVIIDYSLFSGIPVYSKINIPLGELKVDTHFHNRCNETE